MWKWSKNASFLLISYNKVRNLEPEPDTEEYFFWAIINLAPSQFTSGVRPCSSSLWWELCAHTAAEQELQVTGVQRRSWFVLGNASTGCTEAGFEMWLDSGTSAVGRGAKPLIRDLWTAQLWLSHCLTCFPEIDMRFFFNPPFSLPSPPKWAENSRRTSAAWGAGLRVPSSAGLWSAPAAWFLWGPMATEKCGLWGAVRMRSRYLWNTGRKSHAGLAPCCLQ